MRSLIILRHGKSDWYSETAGVDRMRPMSRRGQKTARTMGRFLVLASEVPDAAITSLALRATETLRLAMEAGDWNCPVRGCEGLFGDVSSVLDEIRAESPVTEVLLVVGHEPTSSEVVQFLIGGGSLRLPTGALVRIIPTSTTGQTSDAPWATRKALPADRPGCGNSAVRRGRSRRWESTSPGVTPTNARRPWTTSALLPGAT
jgi:phosphohistidine phosphatase